MGAHFGRFAKFILARHAVYLARDAGKQQPWTIDPILREWKFCNVFRELDRVTGWIAQNWREPHKHDKHFWFASLLARRCINLPDTLEEIGYPVPWNPDSFLSVLARRKRKGKPIINQTAYKLMVSGQPGDLAELHVELLLNPLWDARERFRPHSDDTLAAFHNRLAAVKYMGGFHAAQVVADAKYVGRLRQANDWWDFAASGPGSRRGLNRVLGRPTEAQWRETEWLEELRLVRKIVAPALAEAGLPKMHGQDMQNCLCEFNKYEKVRLGESKGRRFVPNPDTSPLIAEAEN